MEPKSEYERCKANAEELLSRANSGGVEYRLARAAEAQAWATLAHAAALVERQLPVEAPDHPF